MKDSNVVSDFPPDKFTICLFCDSCGHRADLDRQRVPERMTVQELLKRVRCADCGSRQCSIRIIYTGAGEFQYG